MAPYTVPLALIGIGFIALVLGNYVSKSMRMPESGWKVSLLTAIIGIAVLILLTSWPPKQGIDLKGGVILIYEIDDALTKQSARGQQTADGDAAPADEPIDMPGLIQALSRRINPGGMQEIVVRAYGDQQVEIIIPDVTATEAERIKKLITTGGFLKFQILANRRDHSHIWSLADEPDQVGQYEVRDSSGKVVGQWAKLALAPDSTPEEVKYRFEPPDAKSRIVRGRKEVLMYVDPNFELQGSHLASVRKGFQDLTPAVFFDTTIMGAALMGGLTESNLPDVNAGHYSLLGIVMDGELISAPRINSTITSSGLIEGNFSNEEVDMLVNVLRAGRLPAVLRQEPISQSEISPLLGGDTIRKGKLSMIVSLVAVLLFMLVYYRFAGLVSCFALALNLLLVLALMIFVGAAFSLPGMAALVLTVGMAVDANVLIYERIREEVRAGAAVRMAIRNGFDRATTTIVDANLTTLITALVLYLIGTEQLRAFAIALILGILMTLFTGIFFSRVVFEIAEKQLRIKKLTMMQMFANTDWDLFKSRNLAVCVSAVMIVVSIAAVAIRGQKIFDIDFLGGTSVQLLLQKEMPIAEVRQRADKLRSAGIVQDVSVTQVKSADHGDQRIYRIDTSLPEVDSNSSSQADIRSAIRRVQDALMTEFRDDQGNSLLQSHSLSFTPPTSLAAAEAPGPPSGDDASSASEVAPAAGSGARRDLPADTLLAYAPEVLLAQADLATETSAVPEADGTAATTATDATPSESTASDATSSESPPSDSAAPEAAATSPGTIDAGMLRSQADLTFDEKINAETLEGLIKDAARQLKLVEPDVLLSNPDWDEVASTGYTAWNVKLSSHPDQAAQILGAMESSLDQTPVWLSANQIGSSVAGDKTRLAIAAIMGSLIGIIAYIWVRFQHLTYGLAAVIALAHDVTITLGALALSFWLKDGLSFLMIDEFKISLPVVAALLTIIGYSINDTIVTFDRIRELKGKRPKLNVEIINAGVNQTLSRTILTAGTTLLSVFVLYVMGGEGIHAFAFALLVGITIGTYSSIFIAAPILLWMGEGEEAKKVEPQKAAV